MTRPPQDYTETKAQPHVAIALRMKQAGKSDAELVNNFIQYVICKNETATCLADKSFSPQEVTEKKLEIDVEWYITTQLLPPITRLIEHLEGIEVEFVAQCLGIDPKKYHYHSVKQHEEGEEVS